MVGIYLIIPIVKGQFVQVDLLFSLLIVNVLIFQLLVRLFNSQLFYSINVFIISCGLPKTNSSYHLVSEPERLKKQQFFYVQMATKSNFVQPTIPKLDGQYNHWAMLIENFLQSKGYWLLVDHGIPATAQEVDLTKRQRKASEDQKLKDLKVKNYLFQAIDRSILEIILNKDIAKSI